MTQVRQLERSIALKDLALAEMARTIQEMEASSYDGIFVWKISDFARKRQEAISGRSPAIFSPGGLAETASLNSGVGRGSGGVSTYYFLRSLQLFSTLTCRMLYWPRSKEWRPGTSLPNYWQPLVGCLLLASPTGFCED